MKKTKKDTFFALTTILLDKIYYYQINYNNNMIGLEGFSKFG